MESVVREKVGLNSCQVDPGYLHKRCGSYPLPACGTGTAYGAAWEQEDDFTFVTLLLMKTLAIINLV